MELELIYFNFPFWRAEVPRLTLHLGGVPFRDTRVSGKEFGSMRADGKLPFRQVPILRVDGRVLTQAATIARFCGRLTDMYPNDPWHAAKVDELFDAIGELNYKLSPSMREKDPEKKMAMRAKFAEKNIPMVLAHIEREIAENGSGYCVGERLSVADLLVWRVCGWLSSGLLDGIPTDILQPYEYLRAHQHRIGSDPRIVAWMTQYTKS
ncbi:MAG: glutathione S-transferase [Myxococcota bacterium]|nr:glutathione S-transferase [Myxococcota bacterium]